MINENERAAFEAAMRRAAADAAREPNAGTRIEFSAGVLAAVVNSVVEAATESLRLAKAHADEAARAATARADRHAEHLARLETRLQKLERER